MEQVEVDVEWDEEFYFRPKYYLLVLDVEETKRKIETKEPEFVPEFF